MSAPVISVAQMQEWEKATWATGITESAVIARVGEIVANRISRLVARGDSLVILAGQGHNGEDAHAALEHLMDRRVHLLSVTNPVQDITELKDLLSLRPSLVVDGLFGTGLNRPLSPEWIQFIQCLNDSQLPVLSIDVPSGLNAATGQPEGAAVKAAITLTLGGVKDGLLQQAAWPYVNRLEVAREIGLVECPFDNDLSWTQAADFYSFPPLRPSASHKGEFGKVAIIAGSFGYHGASVLAAQGAQRAQPGLITLFTQEMIYNTVASQLQAVMVSLWQPQVKFPLTFNSVLIGPGLADERLPDELKMSTRHIWRDSPGAVIVDATALDWVPIGPIAKNVIRVVTPHPGEAARLLRWTIQQVQSNRLNALRELSKRLGNCWVVLKGHQTLVGRSTGKVHINPSGNAHLAQGGSGDTLAGYLAGLLAQPALQADPLKTICYGVWQHGAAADALSANRRNWVVEDLTREIGNCRPGRYDEEAVL